MKVVIRSLLLSTLLIAAATVSLDLASAQDLAQFIPDSDSVDDAPKPAPPATGVPAGKSPSSSPVRPTPLLPPSQRHAVPVPAAQGKASVAPVSVENKPDKAAASAKAKSSGKATSKKSPQATASDTAKAAAAKRAEEDRFLSGASGANSGGPAHQAVQPGGRNLGHFPWLVQPKPNAGYMRVAPGKVANAGPRHYVQPVRASLPGGHTRSVVVARKSVKKFARQSTRSGFVPTLRYGQLPFDRYDQIPGYKPKDASK